MKRGLLILFVVMASFFFNAYSGALPESGMNILQVKGVVNVQRAGDTAWQTASQGTLLVENDRIRTSVNSEASIALDTSDKNVVTLSQDSEMSIADIREKHLLLHNGKIFALIEGVESASSFQVRTPTAVAGVSGSGMSVESDGNNTTIACFEDMAYVRGVNADGTLMAEIVIIGNGFKRVIGRFEMPGDLIALSNLDRESWSQFRQDLRGYLNWLRDKRAGGSGAAAAAIDVIQGMQERLNDIRDDNKENIFERDEHQRREDDRENEGGSFNEGGSGRDACITGNGE
ncbi:MAG: FecR family protein [Candidatus Omnitrophota bacterium]